MILSDYIKNYEGILDGDLCDEIIKNSKIKNFRRATTGDNQVSKSRVCYNSPLDKKFEKRNFSNPQKLSIGKKKHFNIVII